MNNEVDRHILLTYFFKKLDTPIDKKELLTMSSIFYDGEQNRLYAHTKRFQEKLKIYDNTDISIENIEGILKEALQDDFRMQEELVRCALPNGNSIDYFYVTVIGVDFFIIEKELKK